MRRVLAALALAAAVAPAGPAAAQGLDMSGGGPVEVTSTDGIEWRQAEQVVVARGNARAVREGVAVNADRLLARYRGRGGAAAPAQATAQTPAEGGGPLSGASEIWRIEAEGRVRIASATDTAQGDRAVYDLDQGVLVLTGRDLAIANPDSRITARDSLEYWSARRMAVARGAAVVENAGRRMVADTLVGYFLEEAPARPAAAAAAPPPAGAASRPGARTAPGEGSRLDRVEAYGNVEIRTESEVVRGERGVYSPVSGMARLLGDVRITRGQNQINGQEALVNLRTGVARLVSAPGARVQGLIVPQQDGAADPLPRPRAPAQPAPTGGAR